MKGKLIFIIVDSSAYDDMWHRAVDIARCLRGDKDIRVLISYQSGDDRSANLLWRSQKYGIDTRTFASFDGLVFKKIIRTERPDLIISLSGTNKNIAIHLKLGNEIAATSIIWLAGNADIDLNPKMLRSANSALEKVKIFCETQETFNLLQNSSLPVQTRLLYPPFWQNSLPQSFSKQTNRNLARKVLQIPPTEKAAIVFSANANARELSFFGDCLSNIVPDSERAKWKFYILQKHKKQKLSVFEFLKSIIRSPSAILSLLRMKKMPKISAGSLNAGELSAFDAHVYIGEKDISFSKIFESIRLCKRVCAKSGGIAKEILPSLYLFSANNKADFWRALSLSSEEQALSHAISLQSNAHDIFSAETFASNLLEDIREIIELPNKTDFTEELRKQSPDKMHFDTPAMLLSSNLRF